MSIGRTLLLALLALAPVLNPGPARAQVDEPDMRSVAEAVARAWQQGDVDGIAGHLAPGGVLLHTPERNHPSLSERMARAALDDLHAGLGEGPVRVLRLRLLGGSPVRGFAELSWSPRAAGTREAVHHTIFLGLRRAEADWAIVEIRILPGDTGRASDELRPTDLRDDPWR